MPWYPGAVQRPVARFNPGGSNAVRITPRRAVFHTAVSGARSLFDYFNRAGNPCSTWYVAADGYCEQYVDSDYRAPAQLEGNHDCLSWESQDMGGPFPAWSGSNVPAWSDAQVERLADIAAWVNQTHGIPLALLPDSINGRTGYGYHRQGINPWRVPNGELWSNANGKVCPGDRRIAQIPQIIDRARLLLTGDDMDANQAAQLAYVHSVIMYGFDPTLGQGSAFADAGEITQTVRRLEAKANEQAGQIAALADDEANILAAIANLPGGVTSVTDEDLTRIAVAVADEQARRLVS